MPTDLILPTTLLGGFLSVMARISAAVIFVPVPFLRGTWSMVRLMLAFAITMALFPLWPEVALETYSVSGLVAMLISEAVFGIAIGLPIAFMTEVILFAMQIMGLQAGYSFASMVDPSTQADSNILVLWGQVLSTLFFFSFGFHRDVLLAFGQSLEIYPPGGFLLTEALGSRFISMGGVAINTGVRLALPSIALLLVIDIAIALMGRVNAQLQLTTLAFSIKMLAVLLALTWTLAMFPRIFRQFGHYSIETLWVFLR